MRNRWSSQLTAYRRACPDQILPHCLVQRRPAFGVTHTHHPIREALSIEIGTDKPSVLFQVGVELLEILLRQLVQRDPAQLRNDMPVDGAPAAVLSGGAEPGLGVVLIPEVHPLPEGHVGADLLRFRAAHRLHQLLQLFLTLPLGPGQYIFRLGNAFVIIAHDGPTLPADGVPSGFESHRQ